MKERVEVVHAVDRRKLAAPEVLDGLNGRCVEPRRRDVAQKPRAHRMEWNRAVVARKQITDPLVANVFEIGLREVFKGASEWRDKSYYYEGCKGCDYIDVCQTGCRMDAFAAGGKMNGKDPLFKGKEFIFKPYKFVQDPDTIKRIKEGARISVPKRIRWRKEDGFHLLNIRWANTIEVEDNVAVFLKRYQNSKKTFTIKDFGEGGEEELANLIYKDAVVSEDIHVDIKKRGVSIDPAKLPKP